MHDDEKKFLDQYRFALIGFSRNGKKFGNHIYRSLTKKGLHILPINPAGGMVDGVKTYKDLKELPVKPQAVIVAVKAESVTRAINQIIDTGIKRVWIIGSGYTESAEKLCLENGIELIHNQCILMYFGGFPHNLHYLAHRLWQKLPRLRPGCAFYDTLGEWMTFKSEADNSEQKYWLGLPENFGPGEDHLMAMYFHQQGSDWSGVLTSGMYQYCRERGIITVSTDYRGPDSHLNNDALEDIKQVISMTRERLKISKWVACGVSMGAITSIQLTYLLPEEFRPSGVVAVLPIYDIPVFYRETDETYRKALWKSYGGSPEEKPDVYARKSPHSNIGKINSSMPFAVFAGVHDEIVPIEKHGRRLIEDLKKKGNPVLYHEVEVDHDPEVFTDCYEEGLEFVLEKLTDDRVDSETHKSLASESTV